MSTSQSSSLDQSIVIQLEVIPDNEQPPAIADIDEVRRSLVDQLTQSGHTVSPASTGVKSGGGLYEILPATVQILHDNKDWLLASIPPVFECLLIARDKRAEREKTTRSPIKITLEIKGKPVVMEVKNVEDATKLIKQLQITQNDQPKIKVHVSKKKRHG